MLEWANFIVRSLLIPLNPGITKRARGMIMDLPSIRSTLGDYYTLRPKGICCSVKQVCIQSSMKGICFGFFSHSKNKVCTHCRVDVAQRRVKTPTDCTQQDCRGCEHLLSNTNKGEEKKNLHVTFNMLRIQARPRLCDRA